MCVCVWVGGWVGVTPNHFNNLKAFTVIQHLSTAIFALQQCLVFRPMRPFLPLSTTRRLCTAIIRLSRPASPNAHAPTPVQGPPMG